MAIFDAIKQQNSGAASVNAGSLPGFQGVMTTFTDVTGKALGIPLTVLEQSPSPFTFKIRMVGRVVSPDNNNVKTYSGGNSFPNILTLQLRAVFGDGTSAILGNGTAGMSLNPVPNPVAWWLEYICLWDSVMNSVTGISSTGTLFGTVISGSVSITSTPPLPSFTLFPGNRWSTTQLQLQGSLSGTNTSNAITLTEFSSGSFPN